MGAMKPWIAREVGRARAEIAARPPLPSVVGLLGFPCPYCGLSIAEPLRSYNVQDGLMSVLYLCPFCTLVLRGELI